MEDHDEDDDAEMADYDGTDLSDDVDPNFDANLKARPQHSGIGNRIPRFPGFLPGNGEGTPVSRFGRELETGSPRFSIRPGTGNRGPDSAGRGFPQAGLRWMQRTAGMS